MNGRELLDELEHIDDELIEKHSERPKSKRPKRPPWQRWGAIAAAAVVIIGAGLYLGQRNDDLTSSGALSGAGSDEVDMSAGTAGDEAAEVIQLAKASELDLPKEPDETAYGIDETGSEGDWDAYWKAWQEYTEALKKVRSNADESYLSNLNSFTTTTMNKILLSADKNENAVYSPANLYMALAMLTETTAGSSQQQILDLLGTSDTDAIREQTQSIWASLYRNESTQKISLANSIWLNNDCSFNQDTLDILAESYYADSYYAQMGSEKTDKAIAEWLNSKTNDLLEQYTAEINTEPESAALMYSTLYFYDQWMEKFDEDSTDKGVFTSSAGERQTVDFMHQTTDGNFIRGDSYVMAERYFDGGERMYFILPDEGTSVEQLLEDEDILSLMSSTNNDWTGGEIIWSMPKFDVSSQLGLKDCLISLGVTDVFDSEKADCSPLSEGLYLDEVKQAARVKVDENGCEAASYVEMNKTAAGDPQDYETIEMNLNRPFLFVITGEDNLPLFAGVVNQIAS